MSEIRKKECDYCGNQTAHWDSNEYPVPEGWLQIRLVSVPDGGLTYNNRYGTTRDFCSKECARLDVAEALA